MEDHSGGTERNFGVLLRGFSPVEDGVNVFFLYREVVTVAYGTLEEDTDGVRKGSYKKWVKVSDKRTDRVSKEVQSNLQIRESPRAGSL